MSSPAKLLLIAARELILDEDHWCQKSLAQDEYGTPIAETDPGACMFCAMGAIKRVCNDKGLPHPIKMSALDRLEAVHNSFITTINDERGHAATIATFDEAIRRLK